LVRRSRHAVGHSLGFAVFPRQARGPQLSNRTNLSSGLALRQSITQRTLAGRPQPPAPLMGFCSLQHSRVRRSTARGLAEPATFRPQGLATLSAAYSLRARAGLVSYRRRSWDSPFGAFSSHKVSTRLRVEGPTYRFSCRCYRRRSSGPARQAAVSGLLPLRESLATGRGVSAPTAGCSLGFFPSRACWQWPGSGSRPASSHALRKRARGGARSPAPQSVDQPVPRLGR
jgi:hypothetical protein